MMFFSQGDGFPGIHPFFKLLPAFLLLALLPFSFCLAEPARWALDETSPKFFSGNSESNIPLCRVLCEISARAEKDLTGKTVSAKRCERQLQKMAGELKRKMKKSFSGQEAVEALNRYIFKDQGFLVDRSRLFESSLDTLLLHRVLEKKKGQCLSLSLIYLCLAEKWGLPVYGVVAPEHFYLRLEDNDLKRNIETTSGGAAWGDDFYLKAYLKGFSDAAKLKALNATEVIAVYLGNTAIHYRLAGYYPKAIELFKTALRLYPQQPAFYTNLGNAYERNRQIAKAVFQYQKAISLNPYLCEAHYNLGLIHFLYTKRYSEALRHGKVAQALGCRLHPEFRTFLEKEEKSPRSAGGNEHNP